MRILDHFGWIARYYDRVFPFAGSEDLQSLLQLPTDGCLLDVGGGTGRVSEALRGLASQIVIADESVEMLQQAHAKSLEVVCAHAERLPFRDGSFERILVVDVLHHVVDASKVMAEFCRLLPAPDQSESGRGGRLVIEEGNIERWPVKLVALAERLLLMRSRFFNSADMLRMLAACDVCAEVKHQDSTVWLIADKLDGES